MAPAQFAVVMDFCCSSHTHRRVWSRLVDHARCMIELPSMNHAFFFFLFFFLSRSWGVSSIILVFSKGASRDGSLRICWALGRVVSERWERVRDLRDSKQPSSCHASLLDCFVYVSGVRLRYSFIAYISSRGIQMCCLGNVSRPASCEALVCALGGEGVQRLVMPDMQVP